MNRVITMNLKRFGEGGSDFFTNAFNEAYNISSEEDSPSEVVEDNLSPSEQEVEQIPEKDEETPPSPPESPKELTPKEIKELYEQYYGEQKETHEDAPQLDEQTQSALELYKYLEENPHLVQAMRDVDIEGYGKLNNYVPDELTRKMQELESYIEEQRFNDYVKELKGKYEDFDEENVIKFAEENEIYNLEIAYKALKADAPKTQVDENALREQIKKEIMEELKNNSLNTQTIIGTNDVKPIEQNKVNLSAKEIRIAQAMGMTAEEYAKWGV